MPEADTVLCPICGKAEYRRVNIDTSHPVVREVLLHKGTCSPECARTAAIVAAIDRLTATLGPFYKMVVESGWQPEVTIETDEHGYVPTGEGDESPGMRIFRAAKGQ